MKIVLKKVQIIHLILLILMNVRNQYSYPIFGIYFQNFSVTTYSTTL